MIPVFPQQKCACHFCRETTIENNQLKTWPIWVSLKNFSPFDSAVWPAIADIYIYIYMCEELYYMKYSYLNTWVFLGSVVFLVSPHYFQLFVVSSNSLNLYITSLPRFPFHNFSLLFNHFSSPLIWLDSLPFNSFKITPPSLLFSLLLFTPRS